MLQRKRKGANKKKRVGLIGSIVVGAALVTVGVSGDFAWAAKQGELNGAGCIGNCGNGDKGNNGDRGDKGKGHSVPEPSSVILLGAAAVGLGIWSWRRKATES
jgi:PEP-CTERM motif